MNVLILKLLNSNSVLSAVTFHLAFLSAICTFFCESEAGVQEANSRFHTSIQTSGDVSDVDFEELQADLETQIDRFVNLASGWTLAQIVHFALHIARIRPLAGFSHIEAPSSLVKMRAVINVKNLYDDECFLWAVLSATFLAANNVNRVSNYVRFVDQVNWAHRRFVCLSAIICISILMSMCL